MPTILVFGRKGTSYQLVFCLTNGKYFQIAQCTVEPHRCIDKTRRIVRFSVNQLQDVRSSVHTSLVQNVDIDERIGQRIRRYDTAPLISNSLKLY
jgi:hypothetical protein